MNGELLQLVEDAIITFESLAEQNRKEARHCSTEEDRDAIEGAAVAYDDAAHHLEQELAEVVDDVPDDRPDFSAQPTFKGDFEEDDDDE